MVPLERRELRHVNDGLTAIEQSWIWEGSPCEVRVGEDHFYQQPAFRLRAGGDGTALTCTEQAARRRRKCVHMKLAD